MPAIISMKDKKIGRLKVLRKNSAIKKGGASWICKCDCGNIIPVLGTKLRNGNTQSCGCYRKEKMILADDQASFNALYSKYKNPGKLKGKEFTLTKEEFRKLTNSDCFYCKCPPKHLSYAKKGLYGIIYVYNGIDRVDNSKGYTKSNCVSCCKMCNYMKNTTTIGDFLQQIKKIYKNKFP